MKITYLFSRKSENRQENRMFIVYKPESEPQIIANKTVTTSHGTIEIIAKPVQIMSLALNDLNPSGNRWP